jgi:hypothetical protein
LERAIGVSCLQQGRQVTLIVAVFRLLVVTSPVVTVIVVPAAMSVVMMVVAVAT